MASSTNYTNAADNNRTAGFSFRGISNLVLGAGVDSPIATNYDGVFLGNSALINMDLFDINRIEVLRGPQGTLYGKNAVAGVVNIISNKPVNKKQTIIDISVGNLNLTKFSAAINQPLIKDKLLFRVAGNFTKRDGFVENTESDEDLRSLDSVGARTHLHYIANAKTDVLVSADYTKTQPIVTAAGGYDSILEDETSIRDPYDENREIYGASLQANRKFKKFDLSSTSTYRDLKYSSEGSDFSASDNFQQGQSDNLQQASQELRLISKNSGKWKWIGGVYGFYDENNTESFMELRDFAPIFGLTSGHTEVSAATLRTQSYAAYGDVTYAASKKVDLTVGSRYTHEVKDIDYTHSGDNGTTVLATGQSFKDSESFNNLSPKAEVAYKPTKNSMYYARVSRGFKSGGFNNLLVVGSGFAFEEETATNYEIGTKAKLSNQISTSVNAFYFDLNNQQIQSYNAEFGTVTSNAAASTSLGAEVAVNYKPWHRLNFEAEYSYARSRFEEYDDFPTPSLAEPTATTDVTDNRVPFASENSFDISAQYKHPLRGRWQLLTRANVSYKGEFFFDSLNTLRQPGYALLNMAVTLDSGDWLATLWAKNLTNQRFRTIGVDRGAFGVVATAGEPQTYGVNFSKAF